MAQNYSDQDLRDQNFEGQNLKGADFSRADIRGANFSKAKLQNANFSDARLQGTKFRYANLRAANFTNASDDTNSASVDEALPSYVDFSNSKIQGVDFTGAVLIQGNFEKTQSGLKTSHYVWVILVTLTLCIFSSFSSTIISIFTIYYFFLTLRQKLSSVVLLIGWLFSVALTIAIRTFILSGFAIKIHVIIGIALIIVTTVAAFAVKVSIDDRKTDTGYIIWTVIALVALLVVFLATSSLKEPEANLLNIMPPGVASYAKGRTTEGGEWLAGILGAAIGGGLGWRFSQLALTGDKRFSWLWKTYTEFAATGGTTFSGSILTDANFSAASLRGANFKGVRDFKRVRWYKVRHFEYACLEDSYLTIPKVQQLVVKQEVGRQKPDELNFDGLDLEGINLEAAVLSSARFVGTNLNQSNLRGADLTATNLRQAKLENADLSEACLTGACVWEWPINSRTKLSNVKCEYIFLSESADSQTGVRERLPHAPNKKFEPREFEKRCTENIETLELWIRDDVNRQALTVAFWDLIRKNSSIMLDDFQGFEKRDDGVVVKIRVSKDTDKGTVEQEFDQAYEAQLKREKQGSPQNPKLQELIKLAEVNKNQPPLDFIVKLIELGAKMRTINMGTGDYYESINTGGGDYIQGDYINMAQDLPHAAGQIQELIEQLQKKGMSVDIAKEQVARDIATQAQSDPAIKDKLMRWGQSLGDATVSDVVKGAVKLAIRSAGIPLP